MSGTFPYRSGSPSSSSPSVLQHLGLLLAKAMCKALVSLEDVAWWLLWGQLVGLARRAAGWTWCVGRRAGVGTV